MEIEYLSTLKSKVKTFIDENAIPIRKLERIDGDKIVSTVTAETASKDIGLVSFHIRELSQ